MAYQDAWVRGEVRFRGDRECARRYDAIKSVVSMYQRPITVWDLGANLGYFGSRLSEEYGVISVMVEPRIDLVKICEANAIPTTIALTHRLSVQDLKELAASECPEIVLALNVLHHFDDWHGALDAVLGLGEQVIIETPGRGDTGSVNYDASQKLLNTIEAMSPDLIEQSPSHVTPGVMRPMYLLKRQKFRVTRGYCYGGRVRVRGPHPVRPHQIHSTLEIKTVEYVSGETRPWVPGMNLWNWVQLGGSYPTREMVQHSVIDAAKGITNHGDLRPWNLILQGRNVQVIDAGHRQSVDDARGLAETLAWIAHPDLAYVA